MTGWSIAEIQQKMSTGELSARALTEAYLERIAAIDQSGPAINAIIELNPDALEIAARLDAERAAGKVPGPLHGVPLLIKDNIDTADRLQTTAGSLALEGSIAANDAFVVERMRAAGIVLLGKSNLSEWANFRSTRSSSGWSSRGGQTRNPHVLDRSPCGSSSGSGAAVAAALCAVAVGTETDGSVVCPATSLVHRSGQWRPLRRRRLESGSGSGLSAYYGARRVCTRFAGGHLFFAGAWQEPTLIKLAYAFEQGTQARR